MATICGANRAMFEVRPVQSPEGVGPVQGGGAFRPGAGGGSGPDFRKTKRSAAKGEEALRREEKKCRQALRLSVALGIPHFGCGPGHAVDLDVKQRCHHHPRVDGQALPVFRVVGRRDRGEVGLHHRVDDDPREVMLRDFILQGGWKQKTLRAINHSETCTHTGFEAPPKRDIQTTRGFFKGFSSMG